MLSTGAPPCSVGVGPFIAPPTAGEPLGGGVTGGVGVTAGGDKVAGGGSAAGACIRVAAGVARVPTAPVSVPVPVDVCAITAADATNSAAAVE